jgi:hypothetical protein
MSQQNPTKIAVNPLDGELQLLNDLEMGWTVKNVPKRAFTVEAGYTRVYPNLTIPVGMTITVNSGGELIVL